MIKKSGNFFEEHIEKMILVAVGIVCLWLLFSRVLIGRNYVAYENTNYSPGQVDEQIIKKAETLKERLSGQAVPKPPYIVQADNFNKLMDLPIGRIDNIPVPVPSPITDNPIAKRKYPIPEVGKVSGVEVEHIRAVAYMPKSAVNLDNAYDKAEKEPNDLDLITVEGKFDTVKLYKDFYACFAGEDVNEDWRDPCLARPVFAAVDLERQELGSDGNWKEWQKVPPAKIDAIMNSAGFEVVEDASQLPAGGISVKLFKFDNPQVRANVLQPEAYGIASASDEWFPPSIHKKFIKEEASKRRRERLARLEEERARRQEQLDSARAARTSRRLETTPRPSTTAAPMMDDMMMLGGGGAPPSSPPATRGSSTPATGAARTTRAPTNEALAARRTAREERENERQTAAAANAAMPPDYYGDLEKISVTEATDLAKMTEPLIFWAHDDTVKPGNSYRYRIRLGVFNPVAGTGPRGWEG